MNVKHSRKSNTILRKMVFDLGLLQLSDKKGRILPDLILLKDGATIKDLAKEIHSDLTKGLLYGKDLRYNLRLPIDYQLRDRDVVSLISATKK